MKKDKGKRKNGLARQICVSIFLIFHFSSFLLFTACREVPSYDIAPAKGDTLKENMINANRLIAQSEEQQIDSYLQRHGWTATRLDGGVRVVQSQPPTSDLRIIGYEDTVVLHYRMETLGGNEIYDWRTDTVVCGRLQPTRGLDAALRTLRRGSTARVIVPSEQAYGLVGDGDRIRTRVVLVYELRIEK